MTSTVTTSQSNGEFLGRFGTGDSYQGRETGKCEVTDTLLQLCNEDSGSCQGKRKSKTVLAGFNVLIMSRKTKCMKEGPINNWAYGLWQVPSACPD